MVEYEYLDLPEETIRNKDPVRHEVATDEWPGHRLITGLDWNNASQEWHFGVILDDFGQIIPRSPAKLNLPYSFRGYIRIIFRDPADRATRIKPINLAGRVRMTIWAGPESEAYDPVIEETLLGPEEHEPWEDWINYEASTSVVETPLPENERLQ